MEETIEALGKIGQGKIRVGKILLEADSELDKETHDLMTLLAASCEELLAEASILKRD